MSQELNPEKCWDAVVHRDRAADGTFYFAVKTTGVYCRPSCPARRPRPENVQFFATAADAECAGFRACLRCKPGMGAEANAMLRVAEYIRAHADEPLPLERLGGVAGLSVPHLQRTFKAEIGLTPRQYQEACRLESLKAGLRSGAGVLESVFGSGFGSVSRVYERVDTRLGLTPAEYRSGGKGVEITYAVINTSLGLLMIAATDRGLCSVQFGEKRRDLERQLRVEYPAASISAMPEPWPKPFRQWVRALEGCLRGGQPAADLPIDVRATAFQMRVWRFLQSIPPGEVRSYAEVAAGIGEPTATRAVASACARNRVALVIPCHRVIRSSGELGGYRWGLERKRVLLDNERAARGRRAVHSPT